MGEPSYHLSSVLKSKDSYEDFTGPLDVILMLLSKNKIEIRNIRISLLLEQYIEWLQKQEELNLDVQSEFVQMAAQLTYIKTRMLLTPDREEVTELSELVEQLEKLQDRDMLEAIRQVSPQLATLAEAGSRLLAKEPMPLSGKREYSILPEDLLHSISTLTAKSVIGEKQENEKSLFRSIPQAVSYSLKKKSEELLAVFRERDTMSLSGLYSLCRSRSELVATLLSILELCSDGLLCLRLEQEWIVCAGGDRGTE